MQHSPKPIALAVALALGSLANANAQENAQTLPDVDVIDFRGEQMDSIKYTRPLQETPRIITVLPQDLLEEQNVTSLNEALRNIPGISLQAGEGNPPGGDQLKIRGFNARDDINVNGMRDIGNYFRDPFFIEQLEVVKGPNSAFSGRGSAGGTINFVTKQPLGIDFNRAEVSVGTDNFFRTTLDMNRVLDEDEALRINLMKHSADLPGRNTAEEDRYGVYAAYTWGLNKPTSITADVLHIKTNDIPDAGLPFDRRNGGTGRLPDGINFDNFYGHTNDYKDIEVNQIGLAVQHALASGQVIRNQTRFAQVGNDSITSSPRFVDNGTGVGNNNPASGFAVGNLKPRDQVDTSFRNQTDLLFSLNTGSIQHDMVAGFDFGFYEYENRRRLDTNGPVTSLFNPAEREFTGTLAYGGIHRFETEEMGLYLLDTMKFNEKWELNAGIRYDKVKAFANEEDRQNSTAAGLTPQQAENRSFMREDTETSYSLGLVHKLTPKHALYASYGTAFNISGNFDRNQIQLAGGSMNDRVAGNTFDTPTEKIQAYELGSKMTIGEGLDINAAVFRTETDEGRLPAPAAGGVTTPNVEYYIDGFEVLVAGQVSKAWKLYSGYTYLESEVTSAPTSPFSVGQELGGTPKHSFNIFTTYDITPKITLGGGLQYVDEQTSGVQPDTTGNVKVTIPSYTVVDLYTTYKFTKDVQVRLNLYNVFDERYISQLAEGGGQGIPGEGRQLIATLRYDF
ncbi:MAG: TonB-dependent siderophore receptor [Limnobacter sp.]|jgi:catecholate siderophore receptor|uniref:TonB-dependent receptor n=1 Tax=Limnobacter sp. TaxID=2003368 RepID=UPI001221B5B7|nr:TonB-dependent siderophore receptor [Limnobacter sp.]MDZ4051264.1 TonB-dependent siderophore receptor [Limnobacter sp.]RZO93638.1 MAG: TonB-dependent siderophore receptor [Limnobacter sp.]